MIVITPHQLAATWPNNVVLPGLVMLSILPASAWVVHRDWYLAQRRHIQLALRICTLVSTHMLVMLVGATSLIHMCEDRALQITDSA